MLQIARLNECLKLNSKLCFDIFGRTFNILWVFNGGQIIEITCLIEWNVLMLLTNNPITHNVEF